jgi:cellobiose phosphorylase
MNKSLLPKFLKIIRPKTTSPRPRKEIPSRPKSLTREDLFDFAKNLASSHSAEVSGRGSRKLYQRFRANCNDLEGAYRLFAEASKNKSPLTPGAEWLLDNYHVVQKQITDIKRHFPHGYDRSLPKITEGNYAFYPRVYLIALQYLLHSDSVIDSGLLGTFIDGYQEVTPLTIGELWAVPIMLRFALLENLGSIAMRLVSNKTKRDDAEEFVDSIMSDESRPGTEILIVLSARLKGQPEFIHTGAPYLIRRLRERGRKAALTLQWLEERLREEGIEAEELLRADQYLLAADQISIGNTINSLRHLSVIDWNQWFQNVSLTHKALLKDPSEVYEKCDFKTQDRYRHYIEKLATLSKQSEIFIAEQTVELATEENTRLAKASDIPLTVLTKHSHVGYYLVDKGRKQLEEKISYSPSLIRRLGRHILEHAYWYYSRSILALTFIIIIACLRQVINIEADLLLLSVFGLLLLFPAMDLASNLVQWFVTKVRPPDFLPKLDLSKAIPENAKTAVVVQSLFNNEQTISRAIEALEVRYLANPEPNLIYGLLADLVDAREEVLPSDQPLMDHCQQLIAELNNRYGNIFFVLFRKRLWNESQGVFMAWERKRGKIEEFNKLILGLGHGSFIISEDQVKSFSDISYVVTLDSDSQLPRGVVQKLIGTISHPLNCPILDSEKRKVIEGYSIIQPRVGVSLMSAHASHFAKIFAGHAGLDPYTQTVSEVYQDLFREGSYIGKGIYDVAAFHHALEGRVPENALLSHDLFEGLFARTALATDIELYDDFPARYHVHAKRQHRWARGDWQLLPWIFPRVPDYKRKSCSTPFSGLGRWKLADNLRRSLVSPALFLLICFAWTFLPEQSWFWTGFAIITLAFPVFANLAGAFLVSTQGVSLTSQVQGLGKDLLLNGKQTLFAFCLLPHQAFIMLDAACLTLLRLCVFKKKMLEWETAQSTEQRLGATLISFTKEMAPALGIVTLGFLLITAFNHRVVIETIPLFSLWFLSPFFAKILGDPQKAFVLNIDQPKREYLTRIAWNTWRYFRDLMNEKNNFLVPDNIQMVPQRNVAERTSPTNISLSILSTISAYDLGFTPLPLVLTRLDHTFVSLLKLEKYHGHFLNWYDTQDLRALLPRYVSFVDSGNLAAHFVAAEECFAEFPNSALITEAHRVHAKRVVSSAAEKLPELVDTRAATIPDNLRSLNDLHSFFEYLTATKSKFLAVAQIESNGGLKHGALDQLRHLIISAAQDLDDLESVKSFFGWLAPLLTLANELKTSKAEVAETFNKLLELQPPSLNSLANLLDKIEAALRDVQAEANTKLKSDCLAEVNATRALLERMLSILVSLNSACQKLITEMDFRFLYDEERGLFTIGYNLDNAQKDTSYYDLLASEARLGSFISIALGQIPQKHWFLLGRPIADSPGGKLLLSWGGTMFEFLMPILVMRDFPGTILSQTYRAVVASQRNYGRKHRVPWGISESGYSGIDFEKTYQYHAFGVPGLGLKRGLEDDLVISPYSTLMALPIDIEACLTNLHYLEAEGARGEYGFYEAVDYTPIRLSNNESRHVVQSFLAHHQGMSLISINNILNDGILQDRFHRSRIVKATELLLQEKFPDRLPTISVQTAHIYPTEQSERDPGGEFSLALNTAHTPVPRTHLLSNGHYSVMVDNAGSGFSSLDREISLTRWREDSASNNFGSYIYIRDLESGNIWSTTYQPTCQEPESYEVVFSPDKADFKRRDFGIFTHMEVTVSPEDNVEIRRVSFTNLSSERKTLEVTSYAEIALANPRADAAHPCFSKMFVESEFYDERQCLVFSRRQRSVNEERLFFLHMANMRTQWARVECETSRFEFIGRGNSVNNPKALKSEASLTGSVGNVLDPVCALRTHIELESGATESINFIYGAAKGKKTILSYASRYREPHQVTRAFELAWSQSSVELRNERVAARQNQVYQRLGNALMFNVEQFRADAEVLARNHLPQSGLWRFGISGDLPICLIHITDPSQTKLVQEVLLAHNYLRLRGLSFDLIILNEYPGGYLQTLQEELEYLVRSSVSGYLIDKKGGVFLRTMVQISEEEKDLLFTVARVCLSGVRGNLSSQVKLDEALSSPLHYKVTQAQGKAKARKVRELEFANGLGGFLEQGKAYGVRVSEELPPLPWCNILSNPNFGTLISETGTSYSWADNCRENRITPWSNDPVSDPSPEVIYIRDSERGLFWCPTPRPVKSKTTYDVEHHFGYSTFLSEVEGIETLLTISVANEDRLKWWKLDLKNNTATKKQLEFYLYVDWALGVSREESSRFINSGFDISARCLYASNPYNADFAGRISFIGSNLEIASYSASRQEFLGRNHSLAAPLFLEQGSNQSRSRLLASDNLVLSRKVGTGFDPCGVIKVNLTLPAKESGEVLFFLGQSNSLADLRHHVSQYSSVQTQRIETKKAAEKLEQVLSTVKVSTPDRSFDLLMNGWLVYQILNSRLYGRTGFYQSGGAFGFRDQLQDVLALLWSKPESVRAQILLHASRQFLEGDVQHWWHPPSGKGVRTKISDDFLWLPLVAARYVDATGDTGILEELASYLDAPVLTEQEHEIYIVPTVSQQHGSLYEHCIRAIEHALTFGAHGLPLMGVGDWNDGMNEVGKDGKGESVWMAWFLITVIQEFLPLIKERAQNEPSEQERVLRYQSIISKLKENVENNAWDGDWYRRAYFDDGTPLGSAQNEECQIDSISQTWGILSGAGNPKRLKSAMTQVYEQLVDEDSRIIKLLTPPFDKALPHPGYIKGYAPGIRENGGQYTHAAAWVIIATALMGDGDRAMKLLSMINPINHTNDPAGVTCYQGEPYVFCGDVYAVPPHQGRAGWSWYTGSASWIYQAGLHYILGLNIKRNVLSFSPCVPSTWDKFSAEIRWRNTNVAVNFYNPNGVQSGVAKVEVNGKEVADKQVRLTDYADATEIEVGVYLG